MSSSISFYGIKPADEKFKQMKKVYDACKEAGVFIPEEVEDFFNEEEPDDLGVCVSIPRDEYSAEYSHGYIIDLEKVDKDIKFIKVEFS